MAESDGSDSQVDMFASVWVKVEVEEQEEKDEKQDANDERPPDEKPPKKPKPRKQLKCTLCDYTTYYGNCLTLHKNTHNDAKPFSCELCPYTTKYPASLQRHLQIKHTKEDTSDIQPEAAYNCDECDYKTMLKWNLNAHKRKHKLEKQFKCSECSYESAYRHNFMKHSKTHFVKDSVVFKCDKCPFLTKFEGHITRHLAKVHNEITESANKCDYCDFSTKTNWRLNIHKQRSKQDSLIKCTYCDFETYYMCQYKVHKYKHYTESKKKLPITEDPIENTECKIEYNFEPNATEWCIQVLETNSKERPFQCIMCEYTSRFKASVQRHYQRHHTGSTNRPYKCCNCDFSTKTKDQIALHNKRSKMKTHMACTVCSFTTFYKCQYVLHQKGHYENKCTLCNYSSKHKYELQKHYTTSHLDGGVKCQFCDFKASRRESLLCHEMMFHTGSKPFKCTYCDYQSVRRHLLEIHLKRKHSDVKKDFVVVSESKIQSLKMPIEDINMP